jgi:hypothetical protein
LLERSVRQPPGGSMIARLHAAIYRVVNFHSPRVYRDKKRVCHDVLNNQWNLSDLRWSIHFSDFHIDGAD